MNRKTATTLIEQYFQSWIQQDIGLFLSTLSPSIIVQECYGPVYVGTEEVRRWFVEWHTGDGKGKVTDWKILKILYDESQNMAFCSVRILFECLRKPCWLYFSKSF